MTSPTVIREKLDHVHKLTCGPLTLLLSVTGDEVGGAAQVILRGPASRQVPGPPRGLEPQGALQLPHWVPDFLFLPR